MERLNKTIIEVKRDTHENIINTFVSIFDIEKEEIKGIEDDPEDKNQARLVTTSGDYFLLRLTD